MDRPEPVQDRISAAAAAASESPVLIMFLPRLAPAAAR